MTKRRDIVDDIGFYIFATIAIVGVVAVAAFALLMFVLAFACMVAAPTIGAQAAGAIGCAFILWLVSKVLDW